MKEHQICKGKKAAVVKAKSENVEGAADEAGGKWTGSLGGKCEGILRSMGK